jgi:glycosidase
MSELVLVAKHTPVWLDQLSREHRRSITQLDQVPESELARLAADGFTGLWLVGIWERSAASAAIKQRQGQAGSGASAYAVFDYRVADSLGGDAAAERLQERALRHGLRLAVDVVPNHVGIDSRWVREHPDWLLQVDEPPFASYTFTGPDLSADPTIGIYLEDHYQDQSDAAVVFRLLERRTGRERFVYHGNDGTHTPWNDTAQLDYTQPEVRAAMSDTIVGLARRFPVLRFDAAMTLARTHFQRLWFPAAGDGGAVPSRSDHGMSHAPTPFLCSARNRTHH